MAPGFCTCKRDFPERRSFHPPEHATWHYLCDKPVLPAPAPAWRHTVPTGTGWPPEYVPDDGEAQRIAEVYADAKAELDRGI